MLKYALSIIYTWCVIHISFIKSGSNKCFIRRSTKGNFTYYVSKYEICSTSHSEPFPTLYDCNNLSLKVTYSFKLHIFHFHYCLIVNAENFSSHLNDIRNKGVRHVRCFRSRLNAVKLNTRTFIL